MAALASVGVSVLLFSLVPVTVRVGGERADPLMFNMCAQAGLAAASWAYTAGERRRLLPVGWSLHGAMPAVWHAAGGRRKPVLALKRRVDKPL